MDAFELAHMIETRRQSGERSIEFFRGPTLSVHVHELAAGASDPQLPHTEDEIYYVVEGRAEVQVGDESQHVGPGAVIFVGAGVEHRFHSITEDMTNLIVFAPPRGTRALGEKE